ncbi:MAG: ethanolamine ammonia-lyase subunit EutC [Methylophilaceae bacterium]
MSDAKKIAPYVAADPWQHLKSLTPARIALGRAGVSLPTQEILDFGLAHAMARDAVHLPLDIKALNAELAAADFATIVVESAVNNRQVYLLRPDLGRRLNEASASKLAAHEKKGFDLLILIGDGLSSMAIKNHALPMVQALRTQFPTGWKIAPIIIASQARVALSDEVGELLKAQLVLMLVGERPGLSSPDSLGLYLTYKPKLGRQDSERNCISNVRPEGLQYQAAAYKALWLAREAMRLQCTGVGLKDQSNINTVINEPFTALK